MGHMSTLWQREMRFLGMICTNHYSAPRLCTLPFSQNLESAQKKLGVAWFLTWNFDFHSSQKRLLSVNRGPKGPAGCWGIAMIKKDPIPVPRQLTDCKAISVFIMYFMTPNIWVVSKVPEKQKEWRDKKDRGLEILHTNLLEAGNCTCEAVSGVNGRMRWKHSALGAKTVSYSETL